MFKRIRILTALLVIMTTLIQPLHIEARESLSPSLGTLYTMVPTTIRDSFEREGWNIQVIDARSLTNHFAPGISRQYALAGATVFQNSTIYLSDYSDLAEQSINHELGHYFDDSFKRRFGILPSETQEFINIYLNEAYTSAIMQDYMVSTPAEYFAQSFKYYCEGKVTFMTYYPATYNYIATIINQYESYDFT